MPIIQVITEALSARTDNKKEDNSLW